MYSINLVNEESFFFLHIMSVNSLIFSLTFFVETLARVCLSSRILLPKGRQVTSVFRVSHTEVLAEPQEKRAQPVQIQSIQEMCGEDAKSLAWLYV